MRKKELQEILSKIDRLLNLLFRDEDIQKWLNSPNRELSNSTPKSLLDDGHAQLVLELLEDMQEGNPT